jgi:hypothetical protein
VGFSILRVDCTFGIFCELGLLSSLLLQLGGGRSPSVKRFCFLGGLLFFPMGGDGSAFSAGEAFSGMGYFSLDRAGFGRCSWARVVGVAFFPSRPLKQ